MFEVLEPYTVTATAGANGSVTPDERQVVHGSTASFTVTPASGYVRDQAVGGNCPAGSWSGNTYTTGSITADCAVSFSFSEAEYTVTATAGANGTVTPNSREVTHGSTAGFTVTPASGYVRDQAVGGNCPAGSWSGNTYTTGSITADCAVSFSFTEVIIEHTVTATAGEGGSVAPAQRTVEAGQTATFTVTADAGFTTDQAVGGSCPAGSWEGDSYTTGAITADCEVSFSFSEAEYTVTATAGVNGSVTPNSREVAHGSMASFTVTPASGYVRDQAVEGNCPAGSWSADTYTTGAITADCEVSFGFSPIGEPLIFEDHFLLDDGACGLSRWSRAVGLGGGAVGTPREGFKRYSGPCALRVTVDGSVRYVEDTRPSNDSELRFRFLVFINDANVGGLIGSRLTLYALYNDAFNGSGTMLSIELTSSATPGTHYLDIHAYDDGVMVREQLPIVPSTHYNGWYAIEGRYRAAAGGGAVDVALVDGAATSLDGLNNHPIDRARLGVIDTVDIPSGTLYFDAYHARRDGAVPRLCPGDTTGDGFLRLADRVNMLNEIRTIGQQTAPGQPDVNGDGRVGLVDRFMILQAIRTIQNQC